MVYYLSSIGEIRAVAFPALGVTGNDQVARDRVILRELPHCDTGERVMVVGGILSVNNDDVFNPCSSANVGTKRGKLGSVNGGTFRVMVVRAGVRVYHVYISVLK